MTGRLPLPRRRGGSGSCRSACRLLSEAEGRTGALLSDNREALDAVIAALDQETISGDELPDGRAFSRAGGSDPGSGPLPFHRLGRNVPLNHPGFRLPHRTPIPPPRGLRIHTWQSGSGGERAWRWCRETRW